jgi:hypothetical protein
LDIGSWRFYECEGHDIRSLCLGVVPENPNHSWPYIIDNAALHGLWKTCYHEIFDCHNNVRLKC